MNLSTNTKTLLANVKWHLYVTTQKTEGKTIHEYWKQNVYFRAPYSTRHSRQLNLNREDTIISLIRPGQSAQVLNRFARQKSMEPLAASSEWESHVPKFGSGGAASFHEIHRFVRPTQNPVCLTSCTVYLWVELKVRKWYCSIEYSLSEIGT